MWIDAEYTDIGSPDHTHRAAYGGVESLHKNLLERLPLNLTDVHVLPLAIEHGFQQAWLEKRKSRSKRQRDEAAAAASASQAAAAAQVVPGAVLWQRQRPIPAAGWSRITLLPQVFTTLDPDHHDRNSGKAQTKVQKT